MPPRLVALTASPAKIAPGHGRAMRAPTSGAVSETGGAYSMTSILPRGDLMKLWSGRFQKETDALVNDFNSSISFDQRMYHEDIQGSLAHAKMLGDTGVIEKADAAAIAEGLKS